MKGALRRRWFSGKIVVTEGQDMGDTRQEHWEAVFREKAAEEVSWFQEAPELSVALIEAADPEHRGRVLDIGGGDSRLVDALLKRGWRDVTVLDISEAALSRARERLGNPGADVTWVVADVTGWQPPRTYDVVHDRAVFHFLVDSADRLAYRRMLERAVRPGGHAVIATFALEGPEQCSGLPVARYDAGGLAREVGEGFELERSAQETHVTPWGGEQPFTFVLLRRVS